ncbi:MAG: hypothetical protein AAF512_25815 [Pseudomonadota bacterium]
MQIETEFEVERIEKAMQVVKRWIPTELDDAPENVKAQFDNALLNVAVSRMVAAEGHEVAATVLWRLADALSEGAKPTSENPLDLSRLNS